MKIHLTLIIPSLTAGGAERSLTDLANHWASSGYTVSLVTLSAANTAPFYKLNPAVNLIQLNLSHSSKNFIVRLKNISLRIVQLRYTVKKLAPDVIVSFIDVMNITVLLACVRLSIPIVISERVNPNYHPLSNLYIKLRLLSYPTAKKIVVQTKDAANYFPKKLHPRINIIPNPVKKPSLQKTAISDLVRHVITVGRLVPQKDHATLIHAFAILLKTHPALTLTIIGEGQSRNELLSLIKTYKLEDKIHCKGIIPSPSSALLQADLFIFPSRYEGFPNALCEALTIGLPVIASDCTGNKDIIKDHVNGRLFSTSSVESLVKVADELISDFSQRQSLSNAAKQLYKEYDVVEIMSRWDKLINSVLHNHS